MSWNCTSRKEYHPRIFCFLLSTVNTLIVMRCYITDIYCSYHPLQGVCIDQPSKPVSFNPLVMSTAIIAHMSKKHIKNNKLLTTNFLPVSVLITFSKIFELAMSDQLEPQLSLMYSKYLSAYCKHIGCSSTLTFLLETWQEALDQDKYVGIIVMDLSKPSTV